jgi:hypothetical protein
MSAEHRKATRHSIFSDEQGKQSMSRYAFAAWTLFIMGFVTLVTVMFYRGYAVPPFAGLVLTLGGTIYSMLTVLIGGPRMGQYLSPIAQAVASRVADWTRAAADVMKLRPQDPETLVDREHEVDLLTGKL